MSLWEVMLVEHHKLLGASAKTSCNMRPEHWDLNINHINVTRPQHNHIFCLRSQHKTLSRYWIRRNLTLLGAHYFCCLGYANFPLRILIRAERRSRVGKNSNEKIAWQRGVLRSRAQFDQVDTRMNTIGDPGLRLRWHTALKVRKNWVTNYNFDLRYWGLTSSLICNRNLISDISCCWQLLNVRVTFSQK